MVDYTKWDKLEISDDSDEDTTPSPSFRSSAGNNNRALVVSIAWDVFSGTFVFNINIFLFEALESKQREKSESKIIDFNFDSSLFQILNSINICRKASLGNGSS